MKGIVRIRLSRMGRRDQPIFNIVVTKNKTKRDGKPIEVIGTYNPIPSPWPLTKQQIEDGVVPVKDVKLDFDRSKYWISVGAQPSDTISRLFKKAGILYPGWPKPSQDKSYQAELKKNGQASQSGHKQHQSQRQESVEAEL